jgi:hypothetical protein
MKMYKHIFTLSFLLIVGLTGCAEDVANRYYSGKKYPAKNVEEVEILTSKPEKDFIVIADFQSRGESDKSFAKRAALIGADAIIVNSVGGMYSWGEESASADRHKHDYHSHRIATVIKYKTKGE